MSKRTKRQGFGWWLFIGWWWYPIKWIYFSIPRFIICKIYKAITSRKNTKTEANTQPLQVDTTVNPNAPTLPEGATVKTYHTVGMNHRLESFLTLATENPDYKKSTKELIECYLTEERVWEYVFAGPYKAEVIPEPDNPYDPNAIKVTVNGVHVAYVKKGSCAHLLKVIQEGRIEDIRCAIGGGNYKHIYADDDGKWADEYGDLYSVETGSKAYYLWLYITEKE